MVLFEHTIPSGLPSAGDASWQALLASAARTMQALAEKHGKQKQPFFGVSIAPSDFSSIKITADGIRKYFQDIVVIGTGGSSLGAKALAALAPQPSPRLHFLENVDPVTADALLAALDPKQSFFLIVSKSGGTAETLAQANIALTHLRTRLGEKEISKHAHIITENRPSALSAIAQQFGIPRSEHPTDIGGRFSVFSIVGMLPAACVGIDIDALHAGARETLAALCQAQDVLSCPPALGAALGVWHRQQGRATQVFFPYADRLRLLGDWFRQLTAESLGKESKGITPLAALGSVDQHSMVQLFLDGPADKWYTFLTLDNAGKGASIDRGIPLPGSEYLMGKTIGDVMQAMQHGTIGAFVGRDKPVRRLHMNTLEERTLGALLMHFMLETTIAAELMGIDAFNQPAVEDGKKLAKLYLEKL